MSDGRVLGKDLTWTAYEKNNPLFNSEYQDVALNKLIELNAKDIELRAKVRVCDVDPKGKIIISDNSSNAA
ncbi:hypothetical protein N9R62_00125 [Porticoccaceae bacterium]|jgi:hypothetical protein|nr:hypothetical protein [Porticoccaceae bacterium]MDA9569547.1 hypothetical protein [Porticoccaceae bacterium]